MDMTYSRLQGFDQVEGNKRRDRELFLPNSFLSLRPARIARHKFRHRCADLGAQLAARRPCAAHQVELLRAERRDLKHTRALAGVRGLAFTHENAILADVEAPELRSI